MKRLILLLLLLATPAFAGTDDSGLQMFKIDGSDMVGEAAGVMQEDTKFAAEAINVFNDGALNSFVKPNGNGPITSWSGMVHDIVDVPSGSASTLGILTRVTPTYSSNTAEVYYHRAPGRLDWADPRARVVGTINPGGRPSESDMFIFSGLSSTYLFVGYKLYSCDSTFTTTSEITLPGTVSRGALWQNRLWLSYSKTIYYTAAQNYENFTNSATAGGTINVVGCAEIYKLVGTRYGLYIFTDAGIFLLSGQSKAWTLEKISDLYNISSKSFSPAVLNDNVYFFTGTAIGRKLWEISGTSFKMVSEIPFPTVYDWSYDQLNFADSGKSLFISAPYQGYYSQDFSTRYPGAVLDLKSALWSRAPYIHAGGPSKFYAKNNLTDVNNPTYKLYNYQTQEKTVAEKTTDGYNRVCEDWSYKTQWLTLDGNAGNRKEISRFEIDGVLGTVSVTLNYANGDGSQGTASVYLYGPSSAFYPISFTTGAYSAFSGNPFRTTTHVWNAPIGAKQTSRICLKIASYGTQTMVQNMSIRQIRIYYRNIGNYLTNTLR